MADTRQDTSSKLAGIDLSQFYQVFFEEAGENLESMEQMLLELDLVQADEEELNAIFRCAHSVKGGAATFGFNDVAELTHQMETLLDKLRRHELVESTRGPGGGYSLGRSAAEITVADIIVAVDEPIDATGCGGKEDCMGEDSGKCMTHDLWASLNAKMIEYLDSISLKKLVDEQLARGVPVNEAPVKRAISATPVVKPIKVTAPNSVFALGSALTK